jgi:hypothetical protein
MAGVLGVVVGGVVAWFLVADTFNRNLAASLEWGSGWGQAALVVGGLIAAALVSPRFAASAGGLIALGAFAAGFATLFTDQSGYATLMFAWAVGALAATAFASREMARRADQRRLIFERAHQAIKADLAAGVVNDEQASITPERPVTTSVAGAAKVAVHGQLQLGETIQAEGRAVDLGLGGRQAWVAVTNARVLWAIDIDTRAVMNMQLARVVEHEQEGTTHRLTERDPEYAAALRDPSNPHGETQAVLRLDDDAVSDALGRALPV